MTQDGKSTRGPGRYGGFVTLLTVAIAAGAAAATVLRKPLLVKSEAMTGRPAGSADEWLGIGGACRPPGAGT